MLNNRKIIKIVLLSIGLLLCGSIVFLFAAKKLKDTDCLITKLSSVLLDLNEIEVRVSGDLHIKDFKIVNLNSRNTIFENGRSKKGIKNEHGYCMFEVFFKDSLIYEIGHFKHNNWHTNHYTFDFRLENGLFDATLEIVGPDRKSGKLYYKRYNRNEDGQVNAIFF